MTFMTRQLILLGLTLLLLLTACGNNESDPTLPTLLPTAVVNPTTPAVADNTAQTTAVDTIPPPATAVLPTPTPTPPLAATVNGQPILLDQYERELARFEQAQTEISGAAATNYRQTVLNALVEKELILQAASAAGIQITPEMVTAKIEELRNGAGSPENFTAWLEANQYTEAEFRDAVQQDMATELMAARITEDVPFAVEQVHARYIQVDDPTLAQTIHQQIQNGTDFATQAQQYSLDQATAQFGGDLGFFTRWSLTVPEVAEAAFNLQPNQLSPVIPVTNNSGQTIYYLVQTIERDPQRPLSSEMRHILLTQTFLDWLDEQQANAEIILFVDT